ncbi:hypothetical protein MMC24_007279 [Lignoscripta atroalba]|nr:hypothetical protein [Lignoscripta atroalba]
MKEADEGSALLKHVDEDTFARFAEYIYAGDYCVNESPIVTSESHTSGEPSNSIDKGPHLEEEVHEAPEGWNSSMFKNKRERRRERKIIESYKYIVAEDSDLPHPTFPVPEVSGLPDLTFPVPDVIKAFATPSELRPNTGPTEDYTESFLSHARIYVFAEEYHIKRLKDMAIYKLHHALLKFHCFPERGEDITRLIEYSYRKDLAALELGGEPLRNLVAHYAACNLKALQQSEVFLDLLEEGGPFVKDLFQKVGKRL